LQWGFPLLPGRRGVKCIVMSPIKATLRELALRQRDALGRVYLAEASLAIARRVMRLDDFGGPRRSVVAYCSTGSEVGTSDLIDLLLADGHEVAVPVCDQGQVMRACVIDGRSGLEPGRFGILEPTEKEPLENEPDMVLVPGLAFDESGTRLGHGGGVYDRDLAAHEGGLGGGVCFEAALQPSLPREVHDRPMDLLVTEKGTIRCGG